MRSEPFRWSLAVSSSTTTYASTAICTEYTVVLLFQLTRGKVHPPPPPPLHHPPRGQQTSGPGLGGWRRLYLLSVSVTLLCDLRFFPKLLVLRWHLCQHHTF